MEWLFDSDFRSVSGELWMIHLKASTEVKSHVIIHKYVPKVTSVRWWSQDCIKMMLESLTVRRRAGRKVSKSSETHFWQRTNSKLKFIKVLPEMILNLILTENKLDSLFRISGQFRKNSKCRSRLDWYFSSHYYFWLAFVDGILTILLVDLQKKFLMMKIFSQRLLSEIFSKISFCTEVSVTVMLVTLLWWPI